MLRLQPQAGGFWAVYDGYGPEAKLLETAKTEEDLLFDPRYRDQVLLVIFARASRTDSNFALAYANLKLALRG